MSLRKILAILVSLLGLAVLVLGIVFVIIGASKQAYLHEAMTDEKITLELTDEQIAAGEFVDTSGEAQKAGDLVRQHRHEMGTYNEVLGEGRYDPTNPDHLTYSQALNIENYLYLAVASFGLTTVAIGAGVALILAGLALVLTGYLLYRWLRERREVTPAATT